MLKIDIPYGRGKIALHIREEDLAGILVPRETETCVENPESIVRTALERPIGSPRLDELAKGKARVLVITSDHTRPMPSRLTLPLLLAEIRRRNPSCQIRILIGTGMHRPTTPDEMRSRFGEELLEKELFFIHNSERDGDMTFLGTLPSGGELWLNRLVTWADLVVSEGFIEPHFFAGFSGGRKSILPAVASRKTVLFNHNACFIDDPNATQGCLAHNPIHHDMLCAAEKARLAFILNVLLDEDKRIVGAVAGDPQSAHMAGCEICRKAAAIPRVEGDIIFTSNGGYPLDQNLYQAVKGMTAAEVCVRKGGAIIMCAEICDGSGGDDFFHWFADRDSPAAVARDIRDISAGDTRPDQWQAQVLARVLNKAQCFVVTGRENRALVESMHMTWAPDPDAALRQARALVPDSPRVVVIPNGVGVIVEEPR